MRKTLEIFESFLAEVASAQDMTDVNIAAGAAKAELEAHHGSLRVAAHCDAAAA